MFTCLGLYFNWEPHVPGCFLQVIQGANILSFVVYFGQETSNASPVILRVDPQGFYVYWTYQSTVSTETLQLRLQPARSGLCEVTTLQVLESCTWEQTATFIPLSRDTPLRSGSWSVAGWSSQHQDSTRTEGVSVAFLCLSRFHLF